MSPSLASISAQATRQGIWRKWLEQHLSPAIMMRVTGVVERNGELVIFTESASWGVRLRYGAVELEAELRRTHPEIERIVVRVLPKGASG